MRLFAILALLALGAPAAAEPVAVVNGTAIGEAQLEQFMGRFAAQQGASLEELRRSPRYAEVRAAMIEQLIQRELLWQAAREDHQVDDRALEEAMGRTEHALGGAERLDRALRQQGMDRAQLRHQLRQELSIHDYLEARVYGDIAVGEQDVQAVYRAERERFRSPDLLHLRVVRMAGSDADARATAQALAQRLRDGAAFSELKGAAEAADLGFVNAADLGTELASVAQRLAPGEVSQPAAGPDAVYVVQLLERRDGIQEPLDAVAERIAAALEREQREQALAQHLQALARDAEIQRP